MAKVVNIRVELKRKSGDPERNFKDMLQDFKRKVNTSGILHEYKEHQTYESKSEKKRKEKMIQKKKLLMESIESKIINGDKIYASAGLVKKVKSNMLKDKKDRKKGKQRGPKNFTD